MRKASAFALVVLLSYTPLVFPLWEDFSPYYFDFAITVEPEFPSMNDDVHVTVSLKLTHYNYPINFSQLLHIGNEFFVTVDVLIPSVGFPAVRYEEETYLLGKLAAESYVFSVTVQVWDEDDFPNSPPSESDLYTTSFTVSPWWDIAVPDDFSTIRAAIDAADDGDIVFIRSGVYYEGFLLVNRTLSLIGDSQETTIIDGSYMFTPIVQIAADNVTVKGFTIRNSGLIFGWVGGGIYVTNSNWNMIAENTINFTQYGINLSHSNGNTITNNTIMKNDIGIQFMYDSNESTIYQNNFIGNGWQIHHLFNPSNCMHTWDNGSEGNFWSNYNGSDSNGDGVGDTNLPWEGVDYYPLMKPYSWWNRADINYDFQVDILDIMVAAHAYGSTPSMDNWNPIADIAPNYGKIDIFDCVTIAYNYGRTRY